MQQPAVQSVPLSEIGRPILHKIRKAAVILLIPENRRYYGNWPSLPMMLSRLRDDAGEWLGMNALGSPEKTPTAPIGQMTTGEMSNIGMAVGALLDRDTRPAIDDPELAKCLESLAGALRREKAERLTIQKEEFPAKP
jgi:hypothetical protein